MKWDYEVFEMSGEITRDELQKELERKGVYHWELVDVLRNPDSTFPSTVKKNNITLIFKRPSEE